MELWQLDVMGGVLLEDGSELKAVTAIDDCSRYALGVGLVARATTRPVCAVFAALLERYGVPEEVLTDNGKVFTGRYASGPVEVLSGKICRQNGITRRLTAPRSPTTTGKIERFHGTLRRELLDGLAFGDLRAAQLRIDRRLEEYNTDRPHQSLGRCTPAERFAARGPAAGPPLDLSALAARRGGDDWVSRRVAGNGIICVAWQQLSAGKHRAGEVVDVHVTPRLLEVWVRERPDQDRHPRLGRRRPQEARQQAGDRAAVTGARITMEAAAPPLACWCPRRGYGPAPPVSRVLRIALRATALRAAPDPGDLCGPAGRNRGQAQPAPASRRGHQQASPLAGKEASHPRRAGQARQS
jgi:hypothetical protein